jgi:SPASM domain peptide maturase of grasp-with-spasm system
MENLLKLMSDKIPLFFECCRPVKGISQGAVFDLQRERYISVPNDLIDIITLGGKKTVSDTIQDFDEDDRSTYQDYLEYLYKLEYIFFVDSDQLNWYPPMNMDWDHPSEITNAILEFDTNSKHDLDKIFKGLEDVGCLALEIRIYDEFELDYLAEILDCAANTGITSIALKYNYFPGLSSEKIISSTEKKYFNLHSIEVYGAKKEEISTVSQRVKVLLHEDQLLSSTHCGFISKESFILNKTFFLESMNFNSCLNRKVVVDVKGQVKNCPAMTEIFGSHHEVSLQNVARESAFQAKWAITKDEVIVCKSCEFRYVCLDCRAFQANPAEGQLHGKPIKCNYDPLSGEWL